MTDFYSASGAPTTSSSGSSATIRAEFTSIQTAFGLLAGYTGKPNQIPFNNSSGTGQTALSTFTFDGSTLLAPSAHITGVFTVDGHVNLEGITATGATGSGKLVFSNSPALVTPALGTPASGVLTNCTGTASGLTAGSAATVTTTIASGAVGTTQSAGDNSTKIATTAYADAAGFTTGDIKVTLNPVAATGWVLMDDGTIGDATSGATTRANADTAALYAVLWNNTTNANCAVSTGRGASAAADFAAHKTIALPKALGRAIAVYGSGSGLTARALALALGDENLQAHTHTGTTGGQSADHTHQYANANFLAGGSWPGTGSVNTQNYTTGGTSNDHTHSFTSDSTGAGSAQNMQPTVFLNIHVKL